MRAWTKMSLALVFLAGCATQSNRDLVAGRAAYLTHRETAEDEQAADREEGPSPFASPEALEDYIGIALKRNAGLQASFESWQASLERVPQVKALPDPKFTYTNFIEEVQTRTGPQNNRFQLSQGIPWPMKLVHQGKAASERAESLWWIVQFGALRVVRDVKFTYYEYAYLEQAIGIVDENLHLLRGLEPIVQRNVQTGGSQSDLLRLQVEIGKIENDLETLIDRRPAISVRLRSLLNDTSTELLPWPKSLEAEPRQLEVETLRTLLTQENPQLKMLKYRIREADERTTLARLQRFPDFTLGVGFIDTGDAVTSPRPSGSGNDPVSISFGLSLPIWNQKYSAGEREAQARHRSAQSVYTQQRNDLYSDLEMMFYRFDDARRQVSLYRDTLIPRARQALEVTEISYESATADLLDVIDSQRDLLAFEMSFWRSVSDYNQRLAEIEALCGGTLP